ncbi:hypothetical protein LWI28_014961 [Acer negundo]|uniref:Uncharacterized protein n=1 Tax=Acer negundo TaxID=4023 RepID=A0AAD5NJ84_ACENE|nr:hypothetical protein LWI28_014961 [Acer negundo]
MISQDLFLLENQIPYEVLDDIMTSVTKGGANMRNLIDKFIDQTVREIRGSPLTSPSPTSTTTSPQQQQPPPAHLLQLLRNRLVGVHDHHETDEKTKTGKRVDFLNDSQIITSYIFFLHSLIDQPDDVKELRKAHVLINNNDDDDDDAVAGSNKEAARLLKEIGSSDVGSIPEAYLEVKELIQKHCEKKWKTLTAYAFNNRFSGPSTLFAFAAGITDAAVKYGTVNKGILGDIES